MQRLVRFLFSLVLMFSFVSCVSTDEVVHHPIPEEPVFVESALYPKLKKQLPPIPAKGDARQKADEAELFALQKSRTPADCDRAKSEIFVSLENFFGAPYGPLDKEAVASLTPFFEQLRNDGDYFIQKLKKDLPRPRPFLYLQELRPCVAKEVTGAYPSGHAALSNLYALILADLYPQHKSVLVARAGRISDDRILSGMHHRSDIEAGKKLADLMYREFKNSPRFQKEYAKYSKGKQKVTPTKSSLK